MSTALVIGNFDGVHLGHAELARRARAGVGEDGVVRMLTFDPHPLTTLRPDAAPARLSTLAQRERWLIEAGASEVVQLAPEPELLALEPAAFVERVVAEYAPSLFVEGPDFRFGRGRSGTVQTLADLGPRFGFELDRAPSVEGVLEDQSVVRISSSLIRWLIGRGRVADATRVLGRRYELECPVVRGNQRGREMNVPTANLDHGDRQLPRDGIYAGSARLPDGSVHPAAISVGTKPTFGANPRVCEAHVLDWNGEFDDYGWTIHLSFHEWLRDQLFYPEMDLLVAQIERDIDAVRRRVVGCATS